MVVQNYEDEYAFTEEHLEWLEIISPQISLSIQRKQSEQLLKQSEMKLRESNLTKDRFFNIIAHDLKNPFNAIIGFSNLLIEEWDEFKDEEKIAMVSSIKASSEGAYELLMNLLEWSRLHVGKITYDPEFIDISTLVRLNFSLLKAGADAKNIQLLTCEACDKMVWADPNMINTVIRNLLTNAVKFTRQNGIIRINCQKLPDHSGMVVVSIEDSGVGMDANKIDGIFDIISDRVSTGTAGETGTGLGLVLCKEFIEKNKGRIWVESQKNVGSTFYFSLPFKPV
jgi:signal transduction histidine kinase